MSSASWAIGRDCSGSSPGRASRRPRSSPGSTRPDAAALDRQHGAVDRAELRPGLDDQLIVASCNAGRALTPGARSNVNGPALVPSAVCRCRGRARGPPSSESVVPPGTGRRVAGRREDRARAAACVQSSVKRGGVGDQVAVAVVRLAQEPVEVERLVRDLGVVEHRQDHVADAQVLEARLRQLADELGDGGVAELGLGQVGQLLAGARAAVEDRARTPTPRRRGTARCSGQARLGGSRRAAPPRRRCRRSTSSSEIGWS